MRSCKPVVVADVLQATESPRQPKFTASECCLDTVVLRLEYSLRLSENSRSDSKAHPRDTRTFLLRDDTDRRLALACGRVRFRARLADGVGVFIVLGTRVQRRGARSPLQVRHSMSGGLVLLRTAKRRRTRQLPHPVATEAGWIGDRA